MGIFSFVKAGKKTFDIVKPKIAKNLKKRFDTKQEGFKSVDDQTKGTNVDISKKSKIKKEFSKAVSDAYDKFEGATKKAEGGRVGLKFGSKRKSNVQKIKETFGPGSSNPKKSAAKKKKFPDLTGDGKVTFADILKGRGVKRG